jgi:hypothetical protein
MQKCLIEICEEFETISNFFKEQTSPKEEKVNNLFLKFIECFSSLKADKLNFPKEFQNDVKYYIEKNPPLVRKFEDVQIRYLMLSDFYDFARLTKKYSPKK